MTVLQNRRAIAPIAIAFLLVQFLFAQFALADNEIDFTLPDLDGKEHKLSDYRGKWVLVNYWATWCPPSREELPELEILHSQSEGKIVVLGVNLENITLKPLKAFVEEQFLSFPILIAGDQPKADQMVGPAPGMPTSYLIAPDGEIVARQVGTLTAEIVRKFIAAHEANK